MRAMAIMEARVRGEAAIAESSPVGEAAAAPAYVIEAGRRRAIDLAELWRYRELLFFLVWRDVKVRYKQTSLGIAWAVLQPLSAMIVFTLLFGRLAGFAAYLRDLPYPLYVLSGLIAWNFFASAATTSSQSVVGSGSLISKVYFPRLIIPLASVGAGLVDMAVSWMLFVVASAFYGLWAPSQLLRLWVPLLGLVLFSAGFAALLAALTVAYRDFRYVIPFSVQLLMFVTPVFYPVALVPARWRSVLFLNPLAGLIDAFRAALCGRPFEWSALAFSMAVAALVFAAGTAYFTRTERSFADIV
jgi:lipopolysaccharide transport system permease protein